MTETVPRQEAVEELRELYPQGTCETYEDFSVVSLEFNVGEMYEEKVVVEGETPTGWSVYKTIFGRGNIKFYLETEED